MTDEQITSLRDIGTSLKHIGGGFIESSNHAKWDGSNAPLYPLDVSLNAELHTLCGAGQTGLVAALEAIRASYGEAGQ